MNEQTPSSANKIIGAEAIRPDDPDLQAAWVKLINDAGPARFEELINLLEQSANDPSNQQSDSFKKIADLLKKQLEVFNQQA